MEQFCIHILGCGSARPTRQHKPSCQVVSMRGKLFMADCGEGVQLELNRHGLNLNRLGHIFVTHNHGDHVFGLPGLISTMGLLGRTADLHIYGPAKVKALLDVVEQVYVQGLDFEVHFHPVDTTQHQMIYNDRSMSVWSLPLSHRIPCCGYLFKEKEGLPHIRREMIDAFGIPVSQINNIKAGAGWTANDGTVLSHQMLTTPATPTRSYAYCTDTIYQPHLAEMVQGVDLLYHEATYTDELQLQATKYFHSTARQAATVARDAQVKRLCIGHFSASIHSEQELLAQAQEVFPHTTLANEGLRLQL